MFSDTETQLIKTTPISRMPLISPILERLRQHKSNMIQEVTNAFTILPEVGFATDSKIKYFENYKKALSKKPIPIIDTLTHDFRPQQHRHLHMNIYTKANINFSVKQSTTVLDEHDKEAEQYKQNTQNTVMSTAAKNRPKMKYKTNNNNNKMEEDASTDDGNDRTAGRKRQRSDLNNKAKCVYFITNSIQILHQLYINSIQSNAAKKRKISNEKNKIKKKNRYVYI